MKQITDLTRRDIISILRNGIVIEPFNDKYPFCWYGRENEVSFLERLYNLDDMPSNDRRFPTARGDIWQHRENNYDWDDDWIFYDDRFGLNNGEDEVLLKFLCEMFHPMVRNENHNWQIYLDQINDLLKCDGYEITPIRQISKRNVYGFKKIKDNSIISKASKEIVENFNSEYIQAQIDLMNSNIEKYPAESIGKAKELIETCCKEILKNLNENYSSYKDDMTKLMTHTLNLLNLSPKNVDNSKKASESIKKILGSLNQISVGISELRNSYGSGHGKEALFHGLNERHAKLAVGSAVTLVNFLWDTYQIQAKMKTN